MVCVLFILHQVKKIKHHNWNMMRKGENALLRFLNNKGHAKETGKNGGDAGVRAEMVRSDWRTES